MFKPISPHRRGVSLIELATLIAASAVVFAVAIVAFARFLDMRQSGQEHLERTVQTARMAEQFRRDVWSTNQDSKTPEKMDELVLDGDDGRRIVYEIDDDAVHRTVFQNDERQMHDAFVIPGSAPLRFECDSTRAAILIAPLKAHPVEGEDPQGTPLRIVATFARDRRFQKAEDR